MLRTFSPLAASWQEQTYDFALQDDECFVVFSLIGMKDRAMRPMTSDDADTANKNEDTNIYRKGFVPIVNGFYLDRIDIKPIRKSCYGRKLGWKAMKMLTQLADKHKISLTLHYYLDSSDNPHGVQDLEEFYSRFGIHIAIDSYVFGDLIVLPVTSPSGVTVVNHTATLLEFSFGHRTNWSWKHNLLSH